MAGERSLRQVDAVERVGRLDREPGRQRHPAAAHPLIRLHRDAIAPAVLPELAQRELQERQTLAALAILIAGVIDHHSLSQRRWLVQGTLWWLLVATFLIETASLVWILMVATVRTLQDNVDDRQPWLTAAAPGLIYTGLSLGAFGWLVLRR